MYSRGLNRESGYDSTFRNDRLLKESGGVLKFQNMVLSVVREHIEGLNYLDTIELPNPKVKSEDIMMYERDGSLRYVSNSVYSCLVRQ